MKSCLDWSSLTLSKRLWWRTSDSRSRLRFCHDRPVKHRRWAVTWHTSGWAVIQKETKDSRKETPPLYPQQISASRSFRDLVWHRNLPWSGMTLDNASCYWPNIPVSVRLCNCIPCCDCSGTVEADVASWVASKGRRRSPQGEWEADISGTLDVTEMRNWTTGCMRYKVRCLRWRVCSVSVWTVSYSVYAPFLYFFLGCFFFLPVLSLCGFRDRNDNQSVKHSAADGNILTMSKSY